MTKAYAITGAHAAADSPPIVVRLAGVGAEECALRLEGRHLTDAAHAVLIDCGVELDRGRHYILSRFVDRFLTRLVLRPAQTITIHRTDIDEFIESWKAILFEAPAPEERC